MKFREHRGQLDDSMATCVELADRQALINHITGIYAPYVHGYDFSKIEVAPYFMEPDERIGWSETYIVSLASFGPIGFTDTAV